MRTAQRILYGELRSRRAIAAFLSGTITLAAMHARPADCESDQRRLRQDEAADREWMTSTKGIGIYRLTLADLDSLDADRIAEGGVLHIVCAD